MTGSPSLHKRLPKPQSLLDSRSWLIDLADAIKGEHCDPEPCDSDLHYCAAFSVLQIFEATLPTRVVPKADILFWLITLAEQLADLEKELALGRSVSALGDPNAARQARLAMRVLARELDRVRRDCAQLGEPDDDLE
jgi:hypothetical protein